MTLTAPILVTGIHRSGTTWVGHVLNQSRQVVYIPDTFPPNGALQGSGVFDTWHQHISVENEESYRQALDHLLQLRYRLKDAFSFRSHLDGSFAYRNAPARLTFFATLMGLRLKALVGINPTLTPLLKDPIAIFSAPWLAQQFGARPIVLIRHPAAFYASLKRMNWRADIGKWRRQPLLMKNLLADFDAELEAAPQDFPSEAALMWKCIYSVVEGYRRQFPQWHYVRHEDLSMHPAELFENLFADMQLDYTDRVKAYIAKTTTAAKWAPQGGKTHQLKRDSRANIKVWKDRLSPGEIERVRAITEPVAKLFYGDDDW